MLGQDVSETPDFVEGIVKRRGRGADDVWFAEVALHTGGFELFEQLLRMIVRQDRELVAALVMFTRCDDGKIRAGLAIGFNQELEIAG